MKSIFLLLILVSVFSCNLKGNSNYTTKNAYKNKDTIRCIVSEREIRNKIFLDTVIIFVCPKKNELDELHKSNGDDWYETFEQDAGIYNTDAETFLLNKIKTSKYIVVDSFDYYVFVSVKGTFKISQDKFKVEYNSPWLIILFNGIDSPVVTAPVNIEETYNNYFKIKSKSIKRNKN